MYTFKEGASPDIVIIDPTNLYRQEIRNILKEYKVRWESIADNIAVARALDEVPVGAKVIMPNYLFKSTTQITKYADILTIPAINLMTVENLRSVAVDVKVTYTKDIVEAEKWLNNLPDTFTYDSETTGLEHPSREEITMYSFGIDDETAFVISNESKAMQDMVMNFLITTDKTILIHNFQFDGKWIRFLTGEYPKNYQDSQLLAWTYLNHAEVYKAKVGLKALASEIYRDWAVAKDMFAIEYKYDEQLIRYAGIDAAATWYVWNKYTELVNKQEEELNEQIAEITDKRSN